MFSITRPVSCPTTTSATAQVYYTAKTLLYLIDAHLSGTHQQHTVLVSDSRDQTGELSREFTRRSCSQIHSKHSRSAIERETKNGPPWALPSVHVLF